MITYSLTREIDALQFVDLLASSSRGRCSKHQTDQDVQCRQ